LVSTVAVSAIEWSPHPVSFAATVEGIRVALIVLPSIDPEVEERAEFGKFRVNAFPDCEIVNAAFGASRDFPQGKAAS
jgi:hypothetical protein